MFLTLPLAMLFVRSVEDKTGAFVGLANFATYLASPAFARSAGNTLTFAVLTTALTVPLAFGFAYAIQRTLHPVERRCGATSRCSRSSRRRCWRRCRSSTCSATRACSRSCSAWFGLTTIYGLPGMVLAMTFAAFPHAVMILLAALSLSDARLYEAADSLATPGWRKFVTITLPGARYGLISAAMVVFTMAVSEFGVPKVIGGNYSVLAIDIYKQVIGQQNFNIGAVVGLILLVPAVVAFVIDWSVRRRQKALLTARSVPYAPRPARGRDRAALAFVVADLGGDAAGDRHGGVRLVRQGLAVQPVVHAQPLHLRLRGGGRRATRTATAS